MDIWDVFFGLRLKNKVLIGNIIKVYIRSLEIFVRFIEKGLFYKKDFFFDFYRFAIIGL